jgi:hypothetical protein
MPSRYTQTEESLRLKKEQNALSPLCQMPDEILVSVVLAIQCCPSLDDYWTMMTEDGIFLHRGWAEIMLVCTRLRDVMVHSPELWVALDSRWSSQWQELCLTRASSWPLSTYILISNQADVITAIPLLRQSAVTTLVFGFEGDPGEGYSAVLTVDAPKLHSLRLTGNSAPLQVLALGHMTHFTHLSDLTLYGTRVGHNFRFPPTLRRLRLVGADISALMQRLGDLLSNLSLLEHLKFEEIDRDREFEPIAQPVAATAVKLPCLLSLIMRYCSLESVNAVAHAINPPQGVLELTVIVDIPQHTHPILAFARQFWRQTTGVLDLSPTGVLHLSQYHTPEVSQPCSGNFSLILQAGRKEPENHSLHLTLHYRDCLAIPADDPFLALVAEVKIDLVTHTQLVLNPEVCPGFANLPALRVLYLPLLSMPWTIDRIQTWIDNYAPQGVRVEFLRVYDAERPNLVWRPGDGSLQSLYQAEQQAARAEADAWPVSEDQQAVADAWSAAEPSADWLESALGW